MASFVDAEKSEPRFLSGNRQAPHSPTSAPSATPAAPLPSPCPLSDSLVTELNVYILF